MKTKVITFVLLLHLVVPSTVVPSTVVPSTSKTEVCTCPWDDPVEVSCLREALQAELTSTPMNIQRLQKVFYFSNNVQHLSIFTNMTVSPSSNSSSECLSYQWNHYWYEDNLLGAIRELISDISPALYLTDPLTYFLLISNLFDLQVINSDFWLELNIQLNCTFRDEVALIDEEVLRDIWENILQWSKAYARAGGPVPTPSDSDKGRVSFTNSSNSMQPDVIFSSICLAFHIFLNLTLWIILMECIPSQINKEDVSSATSSLFWSSAIVGAPFAMIFTGAKLSLTILVDVTYAKGSVYIYSLITCPLLFILLIVELIVAIIRSKHSGLAVPRCMGYCCCVFCFCFFCCCRPGGPSHSHVARALALWFVMAWFQSIATSVVLVIIIVLAINPLPMLAVLAMFVSTYFGTVVFLAVLVHMCHRYQDDRSKHCKLFIYSVIFVGVLVMVCLAIFLFLVINERGGQGNSVVGFIGTLVPSAILSIITFIVKEKVLGKNVEKKPTEADQSSEHSREGQVGRLWHTVVLRKHRKKIGNRKSRLEINDI